MKYIISTLVLLSASMSFAAVKPYQKTLANGKKVTFFKEEAMTPEAFSKASFRQKPDPAFIQYYFNKYKELASELNSITPADIRKMTQEEIDQLYIRVPSGPIAPGSYNGSIVQNLEMISDIRKQVYSKMAGNNPNAGAVLKGLCKEKDPIACLGEMIWAGKRIYPQNNEGEFQLRNAIDTITAKVIHAAISPAEDTVSSLSKSMAAQADQGDGSAAPQEGFPTDADKKHSMLFPAHVYCGQSLFDHRRESIIIDYAWGIDFKPFVQNIDVLAGPGYLNIRDEIRMIRPGLYLGRAYTNKIFLLNFVLENKAQPAGAVVKNSCFDGKNNL